MLYTNFERMLRHQSWDQRDLTAGHGYRGNSWNTGAAESPYNMNRYSFSSKNISGGGPKYSNATGDATSLSANQKALNDLLSKIKTYNDQIAELIRERNVATINLNTASGSADYKRIQGIISGYDTSITAIQTQLDAAQKQFDSISTSMSKTDPVIAKIVADNEVQKKIADQNAAAASSTSSTKKIVIVASVLVLGTIITFWAVHKFKK